MRYIVAVVAFVARAVSRWAVVQWLLGSVFGGVVAILHERGEVLDERGFWMLLAPLFAWLLVCELAECWIVAARSVRVPPVGG